MVFRNLLCWFVGRSVRLSVEPPGPRSELCGCLECLYGDSSLFAFARATAGYPRGIRPVLVFRELKPKGSSCAGFGSRSGLLKNSRVKSVERACSVRCAV